MIYETKKWLNKTKHLPWKGKQCVWEGLTGGANEEKGRYKSKDLGGMGMKHRGRGGK